MGNVFLRQQQIINYQSLSESAFNDSKSYLITQVNQLLCHCVDKWEKVDNLPNMVVGDFCFIKEKNKYILFSRI